MTRTLSADGPFVLDALRALCSAKEVTAEVYRVALESSNRKLREEAAGFLVSFSGTPLPEAEKFILAPVAARTLLRDGSPAVRSGLAAWFAHEMGLPGARPALARALTDEDNHVRQVAAWGLVRSTKDTWLPSHTVSQTVEDLDVAYLRALVELALRDELGQYGAVARYRLARLGDVSTAVIDQLAEKESDVERREALRALGEKTRAAGTDPDPHVEKFGRMWNS